MGGSAPGFQNQNEAPPHTGKDFKTDESLGMDGIDVVLEDYQSQNGQDQGQGSNQGGNSNNEESKER